MAPPLQTAQVSGSKGSALSGVKGRSPLPSLIITADDFGLSESINEGVERAHRDGVLTAASLMVAAPAAADAVRRAKALPNLRVGLHLVVIEGPAVLTPQISSDQLRLGVRYAFDPAARRRLAAEIRAQFSAFAATGLTLDHADAHKHMQLHPVVGKLLLEIGREFGLRAIRVPAEPPSILARCGTPATLASRALYAWSALLRRQARPAGMVTADAVFGIAWSGHMTGDRLRRLIPLLPPGVSELYFHPGTHADETIARLMPDYEHAAELAALTDPQLRTTLQQHGVVPGCYGDFS